MIDVNLEESAIIGPLIKCGREQGRQAGREEGRQNALRQILLSQIRQKFGSITDTVKGRIEKATDSDLER